MKLAEFLKDKGFSPAEFAGKVGVSEMSIRRYVSGERTPEPDTMRRIASVTKNSVTANDFYNIRTN